MEPTYSRLHYKTTPITVESSNSFKLIGGHVQSCRQVRDLNCSLLQSKVKIYPTAKVGRLKILSEKQFRVPNLTTGGPVSLSWIS